MIKEDIINKLKEKLIIYQTLKKEIGYEEEKYIVPDGVSYPLFEKQVLEFLPKHNGRRMYNNAYLNIVIEKTKEKIKEWETL